ncbi:MAG: SMEK domain-containing protein [Dolichospermum sp. DL01]|nr:MAG: SMEK domain-containing protein [Dolichospermum sp. DL01]
MITRGYFIGEIIDELANIAHQVHNRCNLGLTDLNKYLEDFFKEILNRLLDLHLENLNNERSNAPGLDLGDSLKRRAFQITSVNTLPKINHTLKTILDKEITAYDEINILIIGYKQKSYTPNKEHKELWDECKFKKENIWDINKICQKAIILPLDTLQSIHQYIKQEVVRVKIELEIPNQEGEFSTSIKNYIEPIAKPKFHENALKVYHEYHITKLKNEGLEADDYYSIDDIIQAFDFLSKELAKLPRITREFYAFLLERRDENSLDTSSSKFFYRFNGDRLKRICRYSDIDGEIRLLAKHQFIHWNEPTPIREENYTGWTESSYQIRIPGNAENYTCDNFIVDFVDFIENKNIGYQKPIVNLNFSDF